MAKRFVLIGARHAAVSCRKCGGYGTVETKNYGPRTVCTWCDSVGFRVFEQFSERDFEREKRIATDGARLEQLGAAFGAATHAFESGYVVNRNEDDKETYDLTCMLLAVASKRAVLEKVADAGEREAETQ